MTLHPESAWVIEKAAQAKLPPYESLPPEAARALYRKAIKPLDVQPRRMARIEDRAIVRPAGASAGIVPVRLYTPPGLPAGPAPCLVFFHGGGHVIGDLETHDRVCRLLAERASCKVLAVDYRLAPEHKFPAGYDDALTALQWAFDNATALGIDPARIAVGGDSAGGTLSAGAAQWARDRKLPLKFQLLVYPATDLAVETRSRREFGSGYLLTKSLIDWFIGSYSRSPADLLDPRASPGRAENLKDLASAAVIVCGCDPLHDEGVTYAEKLHAAGVSVALGDFPGLLHGSFNMSGALDSSKMLIDFCVAQLQAAFAK
ncbi:MAG: alpha/beta hydrolase [Alphaproteobacteria bacterium]